MKDFKSLYFIGAGGIGMSSLVRYFLSMGYKVGGYDRTPTELTTQLISEGADLHFEDNIEAVKDIYKDPESTIVVLTPAVPQDHGELSWFRDHGFEILKRSQLLGIITKKSKGLCVAGTHGKTTTSTMVAHLFNNSEFGCNAFLGGISKNYHTNLLLSEDSEYSVIEADEYDRSFHQLSPYMAIITATDPDHLDIYGTEEAYLESYSHFTSLINEGGALIMKAGIKAVPRLKDGVSLYTYSESEGDFHAKNIRIGNGTIIYDFVGPDIEIKDIEPGVPLKINVENSVAAIAMAHLCGIPAEDIKRSINSFKGVKRRFDFYIKRDDLVFLDDYAHHPDEIRASISSVKELYHDKKVTAIFQPHLYSRTNDFYKEFAESLSLADEVILLDIYPARELPMEGVTSELIFDRLTCKDKTLCKKTELLEIIKNKDFEVLMTIGAGDIEKMIAPIKEIIE